MRKWPPDGLLGGELLAEEGEERGIDGPLGRLPLPLVFHAPVLEPNLKEVLINLTLAGISTIMNCLALGQQCLGELYCNISDILNRFYQI